MSNERVVQAAEAVEELRQALELWTTRDLTGPNSLHVHRSGPAIIAAADAAIRSLMSIREQTVFEVSRYRNAQDARVNELLTPADAVAPLSYTCADCGRVFLVEPTDPFEAHGAYLDHLAEHDTFTDDPACVHCGGALRWHDGMGVWQAPAGDGWTDQCPPSVDRYHRPANLTTPEDGDQ